MSRVWYLWTRERIRRWLETPLVGQRDALEEDVKMVVERRDLWIGRVVAEVDPANVVKLVARALLALDLGRRQAVDEKVVAVVLFDEMVDEGSVVLGDG